MSVPAAVSLLVAVHCGHLLDPINGKMLGPTTALVENGHVREVASGTDTPPGASEIDLREQTCLPGLIDSHTHLTLQFTRESYSQTFHWNVADYAVRSTVFARKTLLAGFTTVRNLGDLDNESVALRNAINSGVLAGPRIFTAGRAIGSTGGHADPTNGYREELAADPGPTVGIIDSVEGAVKAVRQHYKQNDDVIKIMPSGGVMDEGMNGENPQMTLNEIKAVVETAHDYGFVVAAHAHGAEFLAFIRHR